MKSGRAFGRASAILFAVLFLQASARAQSNGAPAFTEEALFATGEPEIGARALGLGASYAAIADDATALYYNPAGLAQVRRIEMSVGLHHERTKTTHSYFGTESSALTKPSGLGHIAVAYPFPTYRGSLVMGFGVFRARSTDLETDRRDQFTTPDQRIDDVFLREQNGGIWQFTGGLAVELVQSLSFGASLSYWRGRLQDDQFVSIDREDFVDPSASQQFTIRDVTESDVDGVGFDLGLMGNLPGGARLALLLRAPTWLRIRGDARRITRESGSETIELFFVDDRPRLPWRAVLGGSYPLRNTLLTGEVRYTAWDEIRLGPGFDLSDPGSELPTTSPDYASKISVHTGVEVLLPSLPIRVRTGYRYDPLSYELFLGQPADVVRNRQSIVFGAGILVAQSVTLDVAAVFGRFERADAELPNEIVEKRTERGVHLTGAHRF